MFSTWLFCFSCSTEIEAKEACDWLRAAGFPQYAQLYEGNRATALQISPLAHVRLSLRMIFFRPHCFSPPIFICLSSGPLWFYFQASVPVQREGSWERPCYHCWDSHSLSPPFSSSFHLSPSSLSLPLIQSSPLRNLLFLPLSLFLSFFPPSFDLSGEATFMWWSSGLIRLRHKQEMAPVI